MDKKRSAKFQNSFSIFFLNSRKSLNFRAQNKSVLACNVHYHENMFRKVCEFLLAKLPTKLLFSRKNHLVFLMMCNFGPHFLQCLASWQQKLSQRKHVPASLVIALNPFRDKLVL